MKAKAFFKKTLPLLLCMMILTSCGSAGNDYNAAEEYYTESEQSAEDLGNGYTSRLDKIYQDTMENIADGEGVEELEGTDIFDKLLRKFLSGFHRAYRMFKTMSPTIFICSVLIGIFMVVFSRENKRLRRTGWLVFIIGIPFAVILIVFGVGALNSVLLY